MKQKTMTTKDITIVGVMAALVFAATYFLKINMPLTMGYVHLGDSMIFLAVYLFGWKKGALAGAIGGAMSDLIGGYVIWIVPTFAIKFIMAMVAGLLFDLIKSKGKYLYIATYIFAGRTLFFGTSGILWCSTGDQRNPGIIRTDLLRSDHCSLPDRSI